MLAICCNWCSYTGADLAGVSRLQYPPNVRIIRVMCSGMVHPNLVINALTKGADGVIMCGCHPRDCHYQEGNLKAQKRAEGITLMLEDFGLEPERFNRHPSTQATAKEFSKATDAMEKFIAESLKGK